MKEQLKGENSSAKMGKEKVGSRNFHGSIPVLAGNNKSRIWVFSSWNLRLDRAGQKDNQLVY